MNSQRLCDPSLAWFDCIDWLLFFFFGWGLHWLTSRFDVLGDPDFLIPFVMYICLASTCGEGMGFDILKGLTIWEWIVDWIDGLSGFYFGGLKKILLVTQYMLGTKENTKSS